MKRLLGVISVAIFTILAGNSAPLAASEEACVFLQNQTSHRLHFYIDETLMCDASEHGSCAACHITIGKHTFRVAGDGLRPIIKAVDVTQEFMMWTITE